MTEPDSRAAVQDAIDRLTNRFATGGKVLEAAVAARALASQHPNCGLGADEIERLVEESAIRNHAVLLAGWQPHR